MSELVGLAASTKRIAANRDNAKKSTGPKTQRGKSHSRLNALKHGAFATQRLIRGEDEKAYQQLSARVFAETAPTTAVECMLVDQIVGDIWRLNRVEQAERAYFDHVRASAHARALRSLSASETRLVPDTLDGTTTLAGADTEEIARAVRQRLEAATHPDKFMLDGMVSPERAFPYSTLEHVRGSLVRGILQKDGALAEAQGTRRSIEAARTDKI